MPDDRLPPARPPESRAPLRWPPSTSTQLNELLANPKAPELVRAMPSVQLHRVVAMAGRADSVELLAMASPEQIREVLDLELWEGDRLRVDEAMDWLQFLGNLPDLVRRRDLQALDVELIGCVLLSRLRVHVIEDADDEWVPQTGAPMQRTPDGWFLLELLSPHPSDQQQTIELVEQLYQDSPDAARRLLHNLVGELPTELEEMSYRWRNGRLQDLGFADPEEALALYAYLDPGSVSPAEGSADRPLRADPEPEGRTELVQILPPAESFWHRGVARVEDPDERERIGAALLALSNRALAADRAHPSDLAGAHDSLDALHWRLSLGLERLCGGDPARAPEVLAGIALLRISRVGHSVILDVRRKLLAPMREGRLGSAPGKLDRIDPPLSLRIAALAAPRPRRYLAEERRARPFHDLAELSEAETWIASTLAAAQLAEGLPLPRPWPAQITFGDLYRTAVVNRLLGREGPVTAPALARFIREHLRGGGLAAAGLELPAVETLAPGLAPLIESWLRTLEERLAGLDPDHLDLRLAGGLWLTREQAG